MSRRMAVTLSCGDNGAPGDIPQAFFDNPSPAAIDPSAYAAGEAAGKALKQFMAPH
jgi:hypothetical protein